MQNNDWINDERLSGISTEKKEFFHQLLFELEKLTNEEKLPFIMALLSSGRISRLKFSNDELSLLVTVLRENADEQELSRFQGLLQMLHH